MNDLVRVRRALLSTWDKTGLVPLALELARHGVALYSTGGTFKALQDASIAVRDAQEISGNPEAFGGRMKTISFRIGSGILFDRVRDAVEAQALGVEPIDMVVCNLYPFEEYKTRGLETQELIEFVDIGGPTMIRAAAKNYAGVVVLTDPAQYTRAIAELEAHKGATTLAARQTWMREAFTKTAAYDTAIAEHFCGQALRYGENPHQSAIFVPGGVPMQVIGGRAMSYNNDVDLDAALTAVAGLALPACAVVKHENPCGLAMGLDANSLLESAWSGDAVSAFGSVIAFNREVTASMIAYLELADKAARKFVEIVAAPSFTPEARELLAQAKNLRVVCIDPSATLQAQTRRTLSFGTLVQSADTKLYDGFDTKCGALALDQDLAEFALHAARCVKSNAIVIVRKRDGMCELLGIGAGQPNRVKSTRLAVEQAHENLRLEAGLAGLDEAAHIEHEMRQAYLASDAFFPFADGVETALAGGVRMVLEPGGSMRDAEVIEACKTAGATLVFTGLRHFKH